MAAFELVPVTLDPLLASASAPWKGGKVTLAARAYSGAAVRFARFVELSGGDLEIANLLCFPRAGLALPLFGADLVSFSAEHALIAADLSLVPVAPFPPSALPSARAPPSWSGFSPDALFARIEPLQRAAADAALFARVDRLCALVGEPPEPAGAGARAAAQEQYARSHREDDRGLRMLARLFGDAWAGRFLREVMFPPIAHSSGSPSGSATTAATTDVAAARPRAVDPSGTHSS